MRSARGSSLAASLVAAGVLLTGGWLPRGRADEGARPPGHGWFDPAGVVGGLRQRVAGTRQPEVAEMFLAIAGVLTTSTVANALPEYTGRRARSLPSTHSRRSTSEATPAFTRAAMRGARSRPFDVPPKRTTDGCIWSMACFSAAAYGSVV